MPDEVHREITMKHDTAGKKASSLKNRQLMTVKVIQRRELEGQEKAR